MTLREFLKEVGIEVLEDTQGTLDFELKVEQFDDFKQQDIVDIKTVITIENGKIKLVVY